MNTVIRYVVIAAINAIGCDDESNRMQHITNIIFICQFFNTGILLLLCNANGEGQGIMAKVFTKGYDTDFNQNWFQTFGDTIIGAMVFNIWYPFVGEILWATIRQAKRWVDKSKSESENETACITQ